jgi:hypothetical protein
MNMHFENTDLAYLRERADQERDLAARAINHSARAAHNLLAREYERRLLAADSSMAPLPR